MDLASLIIGIIWVVFSAAVVVLLGRLFELSFGWATVWGIPLAFGLGMGLFWIFGKSRRRR